MQFHLLTVLILQVLTYEIVHSGDKDSQLIEEEWESPDAWGTKRTVLRSGEKFLDMPEPVKKKDYDPDGMALYYYKKFISTLFNRDNLQFDANLNQYCRCLVFDILPEQLNDLENISDPRQIDRVLQELLTNMRKNSNCLSDNFFGQNLKSSLSFTALIWDVYKDLWQLLKTSEVQIALVLGSIIPALWLVHRRAGLKGVILLVFGGSLAFGYFMTYLECNRNKTIDELVELSEDNEPNTDWMTRLASWFGTRSSTQQLKKQLRKLHKPKLDFCRPDDVFLLYMNGIIFKQLEFMIEQCTTAIENITGRLSFPFNFLGPILLIYMVCQMCMLTFKYILSPRAWASLIHNPYHATFHVPLASASALAAAQANEDRISGENLKALLTYIKNTVPTSSSATTTSANGPSMSSICEPVLEQLVSAKNTPPNTPDKSTDDSTSDTILENEEIIKDKPKVPINDINKVILEDDKSD